MQRSEAVRRWQSSWAWSRTYQHRCPPSMTRDDGDARSQHMARAAATRDHGDSLSIQDTGSSVGSPDNLTPRADVGVLIAVTRGIAVSNVYPAGSAKWLRGRDDLELSGVDAAGHPHDQEPDGLGAITVSSGTRQDPVAIKQSHRVKIIQDPHLFGRGTGDRWTRVRCAKDANHDGDAARRDSGRPGCARGDA